jgi:hypothetical protein
MKSQPVTRLGQMMYPEKLHMREQTLVNIIRLCVLSFCLPGILVWRLQNTEGTVLRRVSGRIA